MNVFDSQYAEIFSLYGVAGWDGHSAQPICATTGSNVYLVWLLYNLGERSHVTEIDTCGTVHIEVPCYHGLMTLSVDKDGYGIEIVADGLVVLPYCERTL